MGVGDVATGAGVRTWFSIDSGVTAGDGVGTIFGTGGRPDVVVGTGGTDGVAGGMGATAGGDVGDVGLGGWAVGVGVGSDEVGGV